MFAKKIKLFAVVFISLTSIAAGTNVCVAAANPVFLKDLNTNSNSERRVKNLGVLNGKTYFRVSDKSLGGSDISLLWVTDGTSTGTFELSLPSFIRLNSLEFDSKQGDSIYFVFSDQFESTIIKTNGTQTGTIVLFHYKEGDDRVFLNGNLQLHWLNETAYFPGVRIGGREGLWKTDGTVSGTTLVKDTSLVDTAEIRDFITINDKVYFQKGSQLWATDGTEEGTIIVDGINNISYIVGLEDNLLIYFDVDGIFVVDTSQFPWTPIVVRNGLESIGTRNAIFWNDILYFSTRGSLNQDDHELWRSSLTTPGTYKLQTFTGNTGTNFPILYSGQHIVNHDSMYFVAENATEGAEPWATDGSEEGTRMLKDIRPGPQPSQTPLTTGFTSEPLVYGDQIMFVAYHNSYGYELWRSDGSSGGTRLVKDIKSGVGSSMTVNNGLVAFYQNVNKLVYFTANDGINGKQIWQTDLTSPGTKMVRLLNLENVEFLRSYNRYSLYFTADAGINGTALWRLDLDRDDDNIPDARDNCIDKANFNQSDVDHNGVGDACQLVFDPSIIDSLIPSLMFLLEE